MTAAISSISRQLGKLVRLLSSEVDGEALAAARAMGRALKGAGADFHDLAALIEGSPASVGIAWRKARQPTSKPKRDRAPRYDELDLDEQILWFSIARDAAWATPPERERAADLRQMALLGLHPLRLRQGDALRANQILRHAYAEGVRR